MVRVRLKYVVSDTDRHGEFILSGFIFGAKGTRKSVFMAFRALRILWSNMKLLILALIRAPKRVLPPVKGTFGYVCQLYYKNAIFERLDVSTQKWRRRALDLICEKAGTLPIASMKPKHIIQLRDELTKKPGAARTRLKALKALFKWALAAEEATENPCQGRGDVRIRPQTPSYLDGRRNTKI